MITNNAGRTLETNSRIVMKMQYSQQEEDTFCQQIGLNLRKKLMKCHIWSTALYGAVNWTLRKVDQKHLESSEMWCWRRIDKIGWTDRVRNEDVLRRVSEERNILHTIQRRKNNWIGHILRRNCLLKHIIEGNTGGRSKGKARKKK
jgi:hypothetical protein